MKLKFFQCCVTLYPIFSYHPTHQSFLMIIIAWVFQTGHLITIYKEYFPYLYNDCELVMSLLLGPPNCWYLCLYNTGCYHTCSNDIRKLCLAAGLIMFTLFRFIKPLQRENADIQERAAGSDTSITAN